jgi:homoserine O-acetyltransferase/O-succinyltransferase
MNNSVGVVEEKNYTFGRTREDALVLDCGEKLFDVNIRYETYGKLNSRKSNAVLIVHALTGDAHVAGYHSKNDKKPGWWNEMVGPGKAFDTEKYFVVCSNCIGGCSGSTGPGSINPKTGKPYNLDFPVITIRDMVRAQYQLMRHLEVSKWLSIAGGSMGGMQVLQWVLDYTESVESVVAIATTAKHSPQAIAFNWVGRESIMNDPKWNCGNYCEEVPEDGLATARMLAHITYLSEKSMDLKFGRKLRDLKDYAYNFRRNFEVESYLEYQGQAFVERFDANSYLYITRAMDYFDISSDYDGDLNKAFVNVKSKFMLVSFSSDWLYSSAESKEIVRALRSNNVEVTHCDIDSHYGHDAFLLESENLGKLVSGFLKSQYKKEGACE